MIESPRIYNDKNGRPAVMATFDGIGPAAALALRPKARLDLVGQLSRLLAHAGPDGVPEWSRNRVAKALGQNTAYVSLYARQGDAAPPDFPGSIGAFESKLEDFLKTLATRKVADDASFETSVSRSLDRFISAVKSVKGIGVFHGQAGLGKTEGIARYKAANPLAITLAIFAWSGGRDAVLNSIFQQMETRSFNRRTDTKADWICARLQDRAGVLVIDNAHKMTVGAFSLLFDLHDRTGCPIVLVGNPAMIMKLRTDDQLFSRVGLRREAKYKPDDLRTAVDAMLAREAPAHAGQLRQLARQVAAERGHLRSLKHHLRVAADFHQAPALADKPMAAAFKAAHESLIHEGYALADTAE